MLGSFAVGKTSLVQQFVTSMFSEKYQTTIGVKIDAKKLTVQEKDVQLMLWDIHGEDDYQKVKVSYLIGASGYFLVVDGTRANTLDVARELHVRAKNAIGDKPFILLINKSDLTEDWDIKDEELADLQAEGWTIIKTSAKTGESVEEAFHQLTVKML